MADTKEELLIVARLKDQVTPNLNKIDRATHVWGRRMRVIWNGLAAGARKFWSALTSIKTLMAGFIAAAAIGGMLNLARGMSEAAAAAEELDARFSVLFGERTGEAAEFADALATGIGRGRQQMRAMLAESRTFFGAMRGLSEDTADRLAENATQFALDLASFYDQDDLETLRLFRSALVGNAEALDRFGVRVLESDIATNDFVVALKDLGGEIGNDEKALARFEEITSKLQFAIGNAARESDNFTSRMKFLRGSVEDVRVEFGAKLNKAIVDGLSDAGGIERLQGVLRVMFATIAEGAGAAARGALEAGNQIATWIERMGGPDGVIASIGAAGEGATSRVRLGVLELSLALESAGDVVGKLMRVGDPLGLRTKAADMAGGALVGGDDRAALKAQMQAVQEFQQVLVDTVNLQREFRLGQADPGAVNPLSGNTRGADAKALMAATVAALAEETDKLEQLKARLSPTVVEIVKLEMELAGEGTVGAKPAGGLTGKARDQADALDYLSAKWAEFSANLSQAQRETLEAKKGVEDVGDAAVEAGAKFDSVKRGAVQGLVSSLFDVGQGARSAKDALLSLLALTAERAVSTSVLSAFGFADGGIIPGGLGNAMPVHGYANGGAVFNKPHVAVIGEGRYNEAAVPLPDGRRIPVDLGGTGGEGGGSTSVNFTVNAVDAGSVLDLLANQGEGLAAIIAQQFSASPVFRAQISGGGLS